MARGVFVQGVFVLEPCDGPAEMSRILSVGGLCSVGHACFFTDVNKLRVFSPTSEQCKFFRIIRNGHEAYGMVDASLGSAYKEQRRAESYEKRMLQLKKRKSYFVKWQNEVSDRLPGRRCTSFGKLGTPASKTMANASMSYDFKKKLRDLFTSLNLPLGLLDSVKFTACTTLRLEGMFGIFNSKQIVPSALEFKYLSSRAALESAIKTALPHLNSKSGRQSRYHHVDQCKMPIQYKQRRNDNTFVEANERVTKKAEEMHNFCRQYAKGVKMMTRRQT